MGPARTRFALEAGFLILLAVGVGLADLDWQAIVAIMAGGWLLVSLIEVIAARRPPWIPATLERTSRTAATPQPPDVPPLPEPPALEETQDFEGPAEQRRRRWIRWRRRADGQEQEDEAAEAVAVAEERPE